MWMPWIRTYQWFSNRRDDVFFDMALHNLHRASMITLRLTWSVVFNRSKLYISKASPLRPNTFRFTNVLVFVFIVTVAVGVVRIFFISLVSCIEMLFVFWCFAVSFCRSLTVRVGTAVTVTLAVSIVQQQWQLSNAIAEGGIKVQENAAATEYGWTDKYCSFNMKKAVGNEQIGRLWVKNALICVMYVWKLLMPTIYWIYSHKQCFGSVGRRGCQ